MAIDFSQVKTITIPEGSVNKITDSAGNTLWQSASWHTLWEGNVTQSVNTTLNITSLNDLSGQVKLRVTWSCSTSGSSSYTTVYYNDNGSTTTTIKPDSPFQFDLNADSTRYYIVGCRIQDKNNNSGASVYLGWTRYNKSFSLYGGRSQYLPDSINASMTVTKIEQYY